MSTQCEVTVKKAVGSPMGFFERYLTAWVFLCIIAGITLGHFIPGPFQLIGRMEVAKVNMPVCSPYMGMSYLGFSHLRTG